MLQGWSGAKKFCYIYTSHKNLFIYPIYLISCFTVSVTPSITIPESSSNFMISIISLTSPFEMVKVNAFPTLTASFSTHFFSNLFTAFEAIFLTNVGTFSPANRISTFVSAFFLNLPIQETKDPPG